MTRAHRRLHPARGAHGHRQLAGAPTSSSPSTPTAAATRRARGIETYFLNFAKDPHAEEVAARENAISAATLKDLQNLVKAITLNSKIDESRDFAASVQEAMVEACRPHDPDVQDRGVHTAPFYVLIGANMPSVLAEIAFVSHPRRRGCCARPSTASASRAACSRACAPT